MNLFFPKDMEKNHLNLDIPQRTESIKALYEGNTSDFNIISDNESVKNIIEVYKDIEEIFPNELKNEALPYLSNG